MVRERNLLDRNYFLFLLNLVASNLDGSPRYCYYCALQEQTKSHETHTTLFATFC